MFSIIKNLILTALIVIGLQTQWQGRTLEDRTITWLGQSSFGQEIHKVVRAVIGLMDIAVESYSQSISKASSSIADDLPGKRTIKLERSKAYLSDKLDKAIDSTEEAITSTVDRIQEDKD